MGKGPWISEKQIYPLTFGSIGCALVEVEVSGVKVSLILDSGTARGFVITNSAPSIPHWVEDRNEELNPDGSHRGESFTVRVTRLSVLGKVFENVEGSLADWHMFSSEAFNGTVGLDFFVDGRLTLDYRPRKIGLAAAPLPEKLDPKHYLQVDLFEPPSSQGHILYARGRVNGREAAVHFDTGYSVSFVSPDFVEGLTRVERALKFRVFREGVPLELGGHRFILDELRESTISRGTGFDLPVALALGATLCAPSSSRSTSVTESSSWRGPTNSLALPSLYAAAGSQGRVSGGWSDTLKLRLLYVRFSTYGLPVRTKPPVRRTLHVRRTEQWLLVEVSCGSQGGPWDPSTKNDAGGTPASSLFRGYYTLLPSQG